VPLLLRRHIFLLFGREKDNQRYYCFALIASRLEFRSGLMSALGQKLRRLRAMSPKSGH
jgi:hypothetical protein